MTAKMTKPEKRAYVKRLLEQARDADDIRRAIEAMHDFGLPTIGLYKDDKLVTAEVLRNCNDDMRELLKNPPEPPKTEIEDNESTGQPIDFDQLWAKMSSSDRREFSLEHIDPLFRQGKMSTDSDAGYRRFRVEDLENRVLRSLRGEKQGVQEEMDSRVGEYFLERHGITLSPATIRSMVSYWETYTEKIGRRTQRDGTPDGVVTCKNYIYNQDNWAEFYSPYRPDRRVPFPRLKKTLDRMSEPEAFAAWIYGTYTGLYRGRQIFWLHGARGEEGKSFLAEFFGKTLFGKNVAFKSIDSKQLNSENRFVGANFVGCRFIVYPDCNRVHLIELEIIKSLSSGGRDSIVAEEKFKGAQTVTIDARIMVCSNKEPAVRDDNWYTSRLIYSTIDPLNEPKDPNIEQDYLRELPGFLAYAEDCYHRLCADNEQIQLSIRNQALLQEMAERQQPVKKTMFDEHFELSPLGNLSVSRVLSIMKTAEGLNNEKLQQEWLNYMETLPGVRRNGSRILGVQERTNTVKSDQTSEVSNPMVKIGL